MFSFLNNQLLTKPAIMDENVNFVKKKERVIKEIFTKSKISLLILAFAVFQLSAPFALNAEGC